VQLFAQRRMGRDDSSWKREGQKKGRDKVKTAKVGEVLLQKEKESSGQKGSKSVTRFRGVPPAMFEKRKGWGMKGGVCKGLQKSRKQQKGA